MDRTLEGFRLLALREPARSDNGNALRHHTHEFCRPAHFIGNENCKGNAKFIVRFDKQDLGSDLHIRVHPL